MKRFMVLDSWRGICALLVVIYHFRANSSVVDMPLIRNSYLFVDFFFVLSGFVIFGNYATRLANGSVSFWNFVLLRIGRLYPLHLFVLCMMIGFSLLKLGAFYTMTGNVPATLFDFQPDYAIPANLFLVHSLGIFDQNTWNVPSWSISTEFAMCVIFALTLPFFKKALWLPAIATLIGVPLFLAIVSNKGMDVTYDYGMLRCLLGFVIGALCWQAYKKMETMGAFERLSATTVSILEIAALLSVVVFVSLAGKGTLSLAAPFVFGLVLMVFTFETGALAKLLSKRLFLFLGTLSYSIYLTHFFLHTLIYEAVDIVSRRLGIQATSEGVRDGVSVKMLGLHAWQGNLATILMVCLIIGISYLTYSFVEKPANKWVRRFANKAAQAKLPAKHESSIVDQPLSASASAR